MIRFVMLRRFFHFWLLVLMALHLSPSFAPLTPPTSCCCAPQLCACMDGCCSISKPHIIPTPPSFYACSFSSDSTKHIVVYKIGLPVHSFSFNNTEETPIYTVTPLMECYPLVTFSQDKPPQLSMLFFI